MDYYLFGRVMELVHLDKYYSEKKTSSHANSIYYAAKYGKLVGHWRDEELLGFYTYGFFTRKELDENKWSGKEVYSCLLYTSPSPRDLSTSRMPSSA